MGETNKRYPVVLFGVCTSGEMPNGEYERKQQGDVIVMKAGRERGVGLAQMHRSLWIFLSDLEEETMWHLNYIYQDNEVLEERHESWEKRRYCIPFKRLQEVDATFDSVKAEDRTLIYQPFVNVEEDTGIFMTTTPAFSVHGLVFDKRKMDYL